MMEQNQHENQLIMGGGPQKQIRGPKEKNGLKRPVFVQGRLANACSLAGPLGPTLSQMKQNKPDQLD